jgi:signal transduction histidine kinase/CheY-like chemotaxis protein
MEQLIKISIIFLSLIVFEVKASDVAQQKSANGKVVMISNQEGVANVAISIDYQKEIVSKADGTFQYNKDSAPDTVITRKKGLEIAALEYNEGQLTIFMRKATIRVLEGTLSTKGRAVPNQQIILKGKDRFTTISDNKGHFILKIPYSHAVDRNTQFIANGITLKIKSLEELPVTAGVMLKLELPDYQQKTKLTHVRVLDQEKLPFKKTKVRISGESYVTDDDGTFTVDNVSFEKEDWLIDGIKSISIDNTDNNNLITVILSRPSNENISAEALKSNQNKDLKDTAKSIANVNNIVKNEMNSLIDFYDAQAREIEKRNQKISFVIDSLSDLSQLDTNQREQLLTQVDELSKSIGIMSDDFNELKSNSILLIDRLRSLLLKQEEKIKMIELEKELQAKKFRNNLLLVLSILGISSLLLIVVIFIAGRISARKKAVERVKDQLADAQAIAKIASMTYFFKNKQHQYSDHFFRLLGIKDQSRIKKIQRTTDQFIHGELLPEDELVRVNDAFNKSLHTKEPLSLEIKVLSDDEKELFVDLRAKIEENGSGKPVAISSTLQDVTEKKEREFQLIEAKTSAEKANQEKEDFLSTMSHEIRTPLNGIIGLTDHLINSEPPKHQVENLKTLKFSADHLLSLVNDVLDYNKIKAGKMVLSNSTFSLKEHMTNIVKTMSMIALRKGIKLELDFQDDVPNMVNGDKVRLNQVITNLLNNAIKFTEVGSVTLSLRNHEVMDGKVNVYFAVKDTGIGIESSKLDRIFESFEQEDISTSNKHGGTGLGLAISRTLVKLFGGELSVKSWQDVGSEFYFTIPLTKIDEESVKHHGKNASELSIDEFSKLKILCVEDNEVNQLVLSQYFENWKINYSFAATGAEALDKFRKESYDIVFMDINLPDQQGDDVVIKMKEEFPNTDCAFIASTADIGAGLQEVMTKCGMSGHLGKPFSSEELKSIICKYGNKRNTNKKLYI